MFVVQDVHFPIVIMAEIMIHKHSLVLGLAIDTNPAFPVLHKEHMIHVGRTPKMEGMHHTHA